jgi:hypothetical protein
MGKTNVARIQSVIDMCAVASLLLRSKIPIDNSASMLAVRTVLRTAADKAHPKLPKNRNKKHTTYISVKAAKLLKNGEKGTVADHAMPLSLMDKKVYAKKIFDVDGTVKMFSQDTRRLVLN